VTTTHPPQKHTQQTQLQQSTEAAVVRSPKHFNLSTVNKTAANDATVAVTTSHADKKAEPTTATSASSERDSWLKSRNMIVTDPATRARYKECHCICEICTCGYVALV
jgi:hypothetical protein